MRITSGLAAGAAVAALVAATAQPAAAGPAALAQSATPAAPASARWHATEVHVPAGGSSGSLDTIACTGPSCVAGGSYYHPPAGLLPMIAAESGGRWGTGTAISLPANALRKNGSAVIASVSCPVATSCVAVGNYETTTSLSGLITSGHAARWSAGTAPAVPAKAAAVPDAYLTGVSCTSPASCVAVGGYTDSAENEEAMVVALAGGHWRRAVAIVPPPNADANPAAHFSAVSCAKTGYCMAVGAYATRSLSGQVMAATEVAGRWTRARQITLPANASAQPIAELYSVSCTSARDCVATGSYADNQARGYPLIAAYSRGRWLRAAGFTKLPAGAERANQFSSLNGLSCTARSCTAVGSYGDAHGVARAMAVAETGGRWGRAVQIRLPAGAASGSVQDATLFGAACLPAGSCSGVGSYAGTADAHASDALAVARS